MDRQYIDDRHVVARYLADQLADDERRAFEAYFLRHPEILQELEAAARFKVGLMQLRDAGKIEALIAPQPWYRQIRYVAAAAAAIVAIAIGALLFNARNPTQRPLLIASADASVSIASTHTLIRVRGSSYDADIELPKSPQLIALRVRPEVRAEPARYRVALASVDDDESVHELASLAQLQPDNTGLVVLFLNSEQLERGNYQLDLSGDVGTSTAATTSTFTLRVR
jgi:hypothetical protein